jgi:hypothetical protein
MMSKIPVGETISKSLSFAFSNILSIFGIAWFPYLTVGLIAAGVIYLTAADLIGQIMQGTFDPIELMRLSPILGLLWLLLFIANCMVTIGIQRKALGRHPDPVFVYFSLGAPVWRMAGALILAWLVIVVIGLATALVAVGTWFAVWQLESPYLWMIRGLVVFVALCWFIYMTARLTFFLPAVVVAEERIGLSRAWELGRGNFWRMVAVVIAVFLPVAVGFGILGWILFGPVILLPHVRPGMDMHDLVRTMFRQGGAASPFLIAFRVIERIVFVGLANGMIASAYLAVASARSDQAVSGSRPL